MNADTPLHRLYRVTPSGPACDFPYSRDPTLYVALRDPSGRRHWLNRNEGKAIDMLLSDKFGWTREEEQHSEG